MASAQIREPREYKIKSTGGILNVIDLNIGGIELRIYSLNSEPPTFFGRHQPRKQVINCVLDAGRYQRPLRELGPTAVSTYEEFIANSENHLRAICGRSRPSLYAPTYGVAPSITCPVNPHLRRSVDPSRPDRRSGGRTFQTNRSRTTALLFILRKTGYSEYGSPAPAMLQGEANS